jgi:hypothetical protein
MKYKPQLVDKIHPVGVAILKKTKKTQLVNQQRKQFCFGGLKRASIMKQAQSQSIHAENVNH